MGCNCKKESVSENDDNVKSFKFSISKIIEYTVRVFGFLLSLIITPVILLIVIWFMFKMLVLNQNFDLKETFKKYLKIDDNDDDDDDDDDDYDDGNILMMDVDTIRREKD